MTQSYYESTISRGPDRPALREDVRADVAIVGAGYTGLSAALTLAGRGFDVRVLEADRVCGGASGLNGGQLGTGQRREQIYLERRYGQAHADALWRLAEDAKALARERIARFEIACDLTPGVLHAAHRAHHAEALAQDAERLRKRYSYEKIEVLSKAELEARVGSRKYFGGTQDNGAAHLNPLKFGLGLARAAESAGAVIHERTRVLRVDEIDGTIETAEGRVTADHVLIACNGYLGDLVPALAPKIMPINAYIAVTAPLGNVASNLIRDNVAVADTRFVINYFRLTADRRLLFGGGESYWAGLRDDAAALVRPHLLNVFPQLSATPLDYSWGGTIAITPTRLPHVGRRGGRLYFAQGFSGHGVAMAGLAGHVIAEALAGTAERFDVLAALNVPDFPGGTVLRTPLRVLAMIYGRLLDLL